MKFIRMTQVSDLSVVIYWKVSPRLLGLYTRSRYEPRHVKICFLHMGKTKTQRSFVFATWIVQSLYFLNRNFEPVVIFFGCTVRFVSDLLENPEDRLSHDVPHYHKPRFEKICPWFF